MCANLRVMIKYLQFLGIASWIRILLAISWKSTKLTRKPWWTLHRHFESLVAQLAGPKWYADATAQGGSERSARSVSPDSNAKYQNFNDISRNTQASVVFIKISRFHWNFSKFMSYDETFPNSRSFFQIYFCLQIDENPQSLQEIVINPPPTIWVARGAVGRRSARSCSWCFCKIVNFSEIPRSTWTFVVLHKTSRCNLNQWKLMSFLGICKIS